MLLFIAVLYKAHEGSSVKGARLDELNDTAKLVSNTKIKYEEAFVCFPT